MALDHYVTLGRSGLRVSPFCLGAMTFEIISAGDPASKNRSKSSIASSSWVETSSTPRTSTPRVTRKRSSVITSDDTVRDGIVGHRDEV